MKYKKGYKFQTVEDDWIQTYITPPKVIHTRFLRMGFDGILVVKAGYASDGSSGPTIETKSSIAGSIFHDALYELLRKGLLPPEERHKADLVAYNRWVKDGMWVWRAKNRLGALENFASFAADPSNLKKVYETP